MTPKKENLKVKISDHIKNWIFVQWENKWTNSNNNNKIPEQLQNKLKGADIYNKLSYN